REAVERGAADDGRVRMSLGILTMRAGDAEGADATLASARALWGKRQPPPSWFHYASLAAALTGALDRALALVTEGVAAHPHSAMLYCTLATIQERRGDYDAAMQSAERGLHEDGTLPQLHKNLGDGHYRAGRYEDAMEAYQRALKLDPALGADIYFKVGNIRYKWQDRVQAVAYWERALEISPGNELVRTNLDLVRSLLV
ncbi:MAG: tetratricopeptide repeat protein, partial [Gemmatimonadaceae bacterium]